MLSKDKRKHDSSEHVLITNTHLVPGNNVNVRAINSIEADLLVLDNRAPEGVKVRSRACWLEEERPSQFFL